MKRRVLWDRQPPPAASRSVPRAQGMKLLTALVAACLLANAAGCAALQANSDFYRTLPDPCAGKPRSGQDPLCGAPPP